MLDLLFLPATLLMAFALRAVRQGEHRLHSYLMTAAFTVVGLRVMLYPRALARLHLTIWLLTLGLAGITILLGRKALAWRETRSLQATAPRIHRLLGATTLSGLALTLLVWLLRNRR